MPDPQEQPQPRVVVALVVLELDDTNHLTIGGQFPNPAVAEGMLARALGFINRRQLVAMLKHELTEGVQLATRMPPNGGLPR